MCLFTTASLYPTAHQCPRHPTDVSLIQLTSTSVRVNWSPPEGAAPLRYSICFVPISKDGRKWFTSARPNVNSSVLNGLENGVTYIVVVIARDLDATWPADPVIIGRLPCSYNTFTSVHFNYCTSVAYVHVPNYKAIALLPAYDLAI